MECLRRVRIEKYRVPQGLEKGSSPLIIMFIKIRGFSCLQAKYEKSTDELIECIVDISTENEQFMRLQIISGFDNLKM